MKEFLQVLRGVLSCATAVFGRKDEHSARGRNWDAPFVEVAGRLAGASRRLQPNGLVNGGGGGLVYALIHADMLASFQRVAQIMIKS